MLRSGLGFSPHAMITKTAIDFHSGVNGTISVIGPRATNEDGEPNNPHLSFLTKICRKLPKRESSCWSSDLVQQDLDLVRCEDSASEKTLQRPAAMTDSPPATEVLIEWEKSGSAVPTDRLFPLVYDELRRLASHYLAEERKPQTLQPTALVHEAYVRLVDGTKVNWHGRTHFFAVSARAMRRVLIQHARSRDAQKRGGQRRRVTLDSQLVAIPRGAPNFDVLEQALSRLHQMSPRQGQLIELRFFGGLDLDQVAATLNVSRRSAERDWTMARAWLLRELSRESAQ